MLPLTHCRDEDLHWTEHKEFKNVDPTITGLTGPKPDLTYGFPIFTGRDHLPPGIGEQVYGSTFRHSVLRSLRKDPEVQLISAPQENLWKVDENAAKVQILTCFPWAVVEAKHAMVEGNRVSFCYRQAANATSVALTMLSELFYKATWVAPEALPPIVAFTCIGPVVRVWLTYKDGTVRESGEFVSLFSGRELGRAKLKPNPGQKDAVYIRY